MPTYQSPAAAAEQATAIAVGAEVGIHRERILEAFDRLDAINGVDGLWTMGTFALMGPSLKEMEAVFTERLGYYSEQTSHLFAQMQVDDLGLVFSTV